MAFRRAFSSVTKTENSSPLTFAAAKNLLRIFPHRTGNFPLSPDVPVYSKFLTRVRGLRDELSEDSVACDRFFRENGILMEDVLIFDSKRVNQFETVSELREALYGDNPFPILRSKFSSQMIMDENTGVRRQFMIEKSVASRAMIEYRLFAADMAKRGQLYNINGNQLKSMWNAWQSCLSDRIATEMRLKHNRASSVSYKHATSVRRAAELLSLSKLDPEKLSVIVLVTALTELCTPEASNRTTVTGRGSGDVDFDVLSAGVRSWTNTDLESSVHSGDSTSVGRALLTQLCDTVGSAVQFEASVNSPDLLWSQEDRLIIGSELIRWMLSECMVKLHESAAVKEVAFSSRSPSQKVNDKWIIDPEAEFTSFLRLKKPEPSCPVSTSHSYVLVNAFKHTVENRGFKSTGYITLHPSLIETIGKVVPSTSFFRLPPLVIPPAPWGDYWECGYMTRRFPLIRFTGTRDGTRDFALTDTSKLRQCMDYLGSTRWMVNRPILDAIERGLLVMDRPIPGLPRKIKLAHVSRKSLVGDKIEKRTELVRRLKEKQKLDNEEPILLSKLDVARQLSNSPSLYFPHSIDFRGRAYPIPAPFNHQGDDITRSLLRFAEEKALGERGWFWLRIHCANLFGKDKLSFSERVEWVDKHMAEIIMVGEDPIRKESVEFVSKHTDDFWQTIAACVEIRNAVKSGNPIKFKSGLPVQQDGSCNGLQHYAALGRDTLGALAVNVMPSDKVEDVYTVVLEIVKDRVMSDARKVEGLTMEELVKMCPSSFEALKSQDAERNRAILAQIASRSEGVLARKTVKQTVMTICYGVTQIGASDQVAKQLNELSVSKQLSASQMAVLSSYLARLTLSSIDTVFCKAMEIKRWFDKVSMELNKHKIPINWISPSGVVCRQPYRKQSVTSIRTPLQKITLSNEANYDQAPVSAPKQRMGFPPNFIHSLDASHMMLTALECEKSGITFASVHDSYWTHAADVDTMNTHIRQEFYKMYDQPILEKLRYALVFSMGVDGDKIPPLPQQGDLDLKCVLNSPYFFD